MSERCHFCDGEKRITHEVRDQSRRTLGRYCSNEHAFYDCYGPNYRNGKWRIVWVGGNKR